MFELRDIPTFFCFPFIFLSFPPKCLNEYAQLSTTDFVLYSRRDQLVDQGYLRSMNKEGGGVNCMQMPHAFGVYNLSLGLTRPSWVWTSGATI